MNEMVQVRSHNACHTERYKKKTFLIILILTASIFGMARSTIIIVAKYMRNGCLNRSIQIDLI